LKCLPGFLPLGHRRAKCKYSKSRLQWDLNLFNYNLLKMFKSYFYTKCFCKIKSEERPWELTDGRKRSEPAVAVTSLSHKLILLTLPPHALWTQRPTDVSALSSAQRDSSSNIPTELSKDVEPDLTANAHERILTELAHGTKRRPTSELATLTSPVLMLLWWNKLIFASCVSAELIHEKLSKITSALFIVL